MTGQTTTTVSFHKMLRVAEAARILHIHPNTLRKWSGNGLIRSYRIGSRRDRRFTLEDLANFLRANDMGMNNHTVPGL